MYSEEELIEELERISSEYSEAPTWREVKRSGNIDPETICNGLEESWTDLLSEMDFEHDRINRRNIKTWEKEEFLDAVKEYCSDLDKVPLRREVEKEFVSFPAHSQRWGLSWKDILTEVTVFTGDEIKSAYPKYHKNDLVEALEDYEKAPELEEFKQETGISQNPIDRIYDSWTKALRENGFTPNHLYKEDISEEELKETMVNLSEGNLPPSHSEFTNKSRYNQKHIEYIGGWKTLLQKSGFKYNARYSGKNHHNWKGGGYRYYGPYWSESRSAVIERDDETCRLCGETEDLQVHHITPARLFGEDYQSMNEESNLVCLCRDCHNRWEGRFIECEHNEFVEKCLQADNRRDEMSLFEY